MVFCLINIIYLFHYLLWYMNLLLKLHLNTSLYYTAIKQTFIQITEGPTHCIVIFSFLSPGTLYVDYSLCSAFRLITFTSKVTARRLYQRNLRHTTYHVRLKLKSNIFHRLAIVHIPRGKSRVGSI